MSSFRLKLLLMVRPDKVEITELVKVLYERRFSANYELTVGVDILEKDVEFEPGESVKLSIWYVKEAQRFEFIKSTFYKGTKGAIFIFDLMTPESFKAIKPVIEDVKNTLPDLQFMLIGLRNEYMDNLDVSAEPIKFNDFAEKLDGFYLETSLKNGDDIEKGIRELARRIIQSKYPH